MKPNGNFKMSKQNKRFLARIMDPHKRGEVKRAMIGAALAAAHQPRRNKNEPTGSTGLTD